MLRWNDRLQLLVTMQSCCQSAPLTLIYVQITSFENKCIVRHTLHAWLCQLANVVECVILREIRVNSTHVKPTHRHTPPIKSPGNTSAENENSIRSCTVISYWFIYLLVIGSDTFQPIRYHLTHILVRQRNHVLMTSFRFLF